MVLSAEMEVKDVRHFHASGRYFYKMAIYLILDIHNSTSNFLYDFSCILTNHVFFTLPISLQYGREEWRKDLRNLIKLAGSESKDVVLFLPASQLLKHEFLRDDVDSLFARGEIPDLFSDDEKHQLNEVVHKYLMKIEGGKVSEMTPSALYEIFIEISRVKIHIIINYNYNDENAKRMLRMHKSILTEATQLNLRK